MRKGRGTIMSAREGISTAADNIGVMLILNVFKFSGL